MPPQQLQMTDHPANLHESRPLPEALHFEPAAQELGFQCTHHWKTQSASNAEMGQSKMVRVQSELFLGGAASTNDRDRSVAKIVIHRFWGFRRSPLHRSSMRHRPCMCAASTSLCLSCDPQHDSLMCRRPNIDHNGLHGLHFDKVGNRLSHGHTCAVQKDTLERRPLWDSGGQHQDSIGTRR